MKAFRYKSRQVPISWFATLKRLVLEGEWKRFRIEFQAIAPGEPGYEEAPYERIVTQCTPTEKELKEHES